MKKIHLIANAHLDPVWLWRWEEGCAEALSTFRTAADLLEEFPNAVFNHNESILYQWVKENDPALFVRIQKLVKEGRWNIIGGWFLQPDCNMPSGESLVRHIQKGRRFFMENFGSRPTTAVNFDSFGHSRGLVQILVQAGYDSYLVCRPAKDNFNFKEQDYQWNGFHNSSVLVHRSDENYNSVWGKVAGELTAFLEEKKDEPVTLFLWGVGDHGGGPSKKDLTDLTAKIASETEYEIVHSTPEAYFSELREKKAAFPIVERGLNPLAPGCYTAQVRIKQKHRQLENELYSAEKMATAALLQCGKAYPAQKFTDAEWDLLFSEFHDALPGSGSQLVEEDTIRLLEHGLEIVSREKMSSFLALTAGEPKVIDGCSVLMLYNPHPFAVEGDFVCEMGLPKQNWTTDFLYPQATRNGVMVPTQAIKEASNFSLDWRKRVVVHTTLAASSMTRMDVAFAPLPKRPSYEGIMEKAAYVFDNGKMRVSINMRTGLVDSYQVDGVEYLCHGSFQLAAHDDTNSPWSFGSKYSAAQRVFQLMTPFECSAYAGIDDRVIAPIRVIEDGAVETVVEAMFALHDSRAVLRYRMSKAGVGLEVDVSVFFGEKQQYLKLVVPTALPSDSGYVGQVPFGRDVLEKEGKEVVSQKWQALQSDERAFLVMGNGGYGSSCEGSEIGLTLLRSAGYTSSDFVMGRAFQEDQTAPRMEQGERNFSFRFVAGGADLLERADNLALCFNETPYALAYCPSGAGEKPASLYTIDNPAVVVSSLRPAQSGSGYTLRLYQTTDQVQQARLQMPALQIDQVIMLEAQEVATYHLEEKTIAFTTLTEGA